VALALLVLRGGERERLDARAPLFVGGVALLLPLALAIVGLDYFFPRNLMAAWLPLASLVALGCGLAAARRVGAVTAIGLCAVLLAITVSIDFNSRLQRPDWRGVAHLLGTTGGPRALVSPSTGDDPLEYYMPGTARILRRHANVSEIDLIGWPLAGRRPPRLPGFQLVERRQVKTLTVYRYRSPQPVLVARSLLLRRHLGSERPAALEQGVPR